MPFLQQVTMTDRGAAERACKDPNPIIDGRKANVNLAYLGAKPRSMQTGEEHAGEHSSLFSSWSFLAVTLCVRACVFFCLKQVRPLSSASTTERHCLCLCLALCPLCIVPVVLLCKMQMLCV